MSREHLELIRRFYELARKGGWQQLELLSDDVVYRPIAEITEADEYRGREMFRRYMESFSRTSGLDFTARVFVVRTVRGGEIVRVEDFIERQDALAAAGLSP